MSFGIPVRNGLSVGLLASTFLTSGSGRLVPRLTLNFLAGAPLDSRITFTRSTTATFVGSDGLIQSAAINAPRFDYNPTTLAPLGLLIEEQRVNLALYSEQFDNAYWNATGGTVSANNATSPDGTLDADTFTEAAGSTDPRFPVTVTLSIGSSYTLSTYVKIKAGSAQRYLMLVFNAGFAAISGANFDLVAGVVGATLNATGTITPAGNGWFRCTMTPSATATATSASFRVRITSVNTSGNIAGPTAYIGDGASGFIYYGAQLEAGSFATSYIPTAASTVTRAADVAEMTGTNFSSWYNASEGTMVAFYNTTTAVTSVPLGAFGISDGTSNERLSIRRNSGNTNPTFFVVDGGAVQYSQQVTAASGPYRSALAYSSSGFIAANNGTLATAGTGTLPAVTQAEIGFGQLITRLNGHVSSITYYSQRLSDAQLQALTS